MRRAGIIALALTSALALSGCGFGGDDSGEVQTTTVTASPETSTDNSDSKDKKAEKDSDAKSPAPTSGGSQQTNTSGEVVIGHTETPGQANPSVMNKTIASCGNPSMHETGTTFFTDGTSGWTSTCANKMMAARPAEPAPAPDDSYYEGYLDGYDDAQYDGGYDDYDDYSDY
ncbi:hypothetical protein [Corynebacterium jeikeium]|uniref:hypothetical protein n=1 Tax=Corynebacterium jeikeium TaxID=38289 RepID=UPI00054FEF9E|nr:hypothetical protein [Corynebacterium jeikeium]